MTGQGRDERGLQPRPPLTPSKVFGTMREAKTRNTTRKGAVTTKPQAENLPLDLPAKTEAELAVDRSIEIKLQELTIQVRQRNLRNAVALAQQAASGRGPLVEHFMELGRRYSSLLSASRSQRPNLRVIVGPTSPERGESA